MHLLDDSLLTKSDVIQERSMGEVLKALLKEMGDKSKPNQVGTTKVCNSVCSS